MEASNLEKQSKPEEARYLSFRHLPEDATRNGKPVLNRYSSSLTNGHDFPGAKVRNNVRPKRTLQLRKFCSRPCCMPLVYQTMKQCRTLLT